jgi:hypothetical protein
LAWQLKLLLRSVPRLPPTCRTCSARVASRVRLQPVRLDRAFRELSNGVGFVDFTCLGASIQNPESFCKVIITVALFVPSCRDRRLGSCFQARDPFSGLAVGPLHFVLPRLALPFRGSLDSLFAIAGQEMTANLLDRRGDNAVRLHYTCSCRGTAERQPHSCTA